MDEIEKYVNIETCSPEVKKSINWLEKNVSLQNKIHRIAKTLYVLNNVGSPIASDSIQHISKMIEEMDLDDNSELITDDPLFLFYLAKLGFKNDPRLRKWVENLKENQLVNGYIFNEHGDALRVLNEFEPNSRSVILGVEFLLEKGIIGHNINETAKNMITLLEIDGEKCWKAVLEGKENILSEFEKIITTNNIFGSLNSISSVLMAFGRMGLSDSAVVRDGINFIKKYQLEDGSFGWNEKEGDKVIQSITWPERIADIMLGLFAVGEGPKVPIEFVRKKFAIQEKLMSDSIPAFIHTSPLYEGKIHVDDIHKTVREMFRRAKRIIRISSLFVDMLYEELISIAKEKQELEILIITRPAKDIKGFRERIARNVLDILSVASKGNLKKIDIIHSRMIIIDDNEVLVSSADLTRDSLFDEFNAGIWTKNKDTVRKAIEYFDNIWNLEARHQKQEDN